MLRVTLYPSKDGTKIYLANKSTPPQIYQPLLAFIEQRRGYFKAPDMFFIRVRYDKESFEKVCRFANINLEVVEPKKVARSSKNPVKKHLIEGYNHKATTGFGKYKTLRWEQLPAPYLRFLVKISHESNNPLNKEHAKYALSELERRKDMKIIDQVRNGLLQYDEEWLNFDKKRLEWMVQRSKNAEDRKIANIVLATLYTQ